MSIEVTRPELTELAEASLKRAAESFGFMIKEEVTVSEISIQNIEPDGKWGDLVADSMYLLTTEMIGDMKGKSYLLFDKEIANQVFYLCTGLKVGDTSLTVDVVLKEIDNILSASMISEIADKLKVTIYGDVPYCYDYTKDQIKTTVNNDLKNYHVDSEQYLINCNLNTSKSNLVVHFFWVLSGDMVKKLETK